MWSWTTKPVLSVNISFEMYASSESWINKLSIDVWLVRIGQYLDNYLKIWNLRVQNNHNTEKIAFKVVQIKFLAMHITNQEWSFDTFTVRHLLNVFMEHDLYLIYTNDLWHKIKIDNFDPCNVFLAIATNKPQRLKTGFVVKGQKWFVKIILAI